MHAVVFAFMRVEIVTVQTKGNSRDS